MPFKPKLVAAVGEAVTEKLTTPKICCVCQKSVNKVLGCPKCKSRMYCSMDCIIKHKVVDMPLCSMIAEVEKIECQKLLQRLSRQAESKLPLKMNREIVRLVGEKPIVSVNLDGVDTQCLWDTGSMVSVMSKTLLVDTFPEKELHSVEDFLGHTDLKLSAANNTELPIEGVVLFDFGVGGEVLFQVPILVSKYELAHPIVGYNLIEHLVVNFPNKNLSSLRKIVPNLSADSAQIMVNLVEEASNFSDVLGSVKTQNSVRIPAKTLVQVKSKSRVNIDTVGGKDVLFSPLIQFEGEHDLIIYDSTVALKRGKSQCLNVGVYNPTSREITLSKGTVVGALHDISMVVHLPSSQVEAQAQINSVEVNMESDNPNEWLEQIDLSHLDNEKQSEMTETLQKLHMGFSKKKNDIGFIPDFKMQINLTDNIPISEPYRRIPRLLYDEVKAHINDLLANGWIRQSQSSYSSPMVCVRKKDGSLRLCIDYRKLNAKTIPDRQPIPRVQDLLEGLGGQKWFTTLDMSQAYHQGQISEESHKFTAFSSP